MQEKVSLVQIPGKWIPKEAIIPPENSNETNSKEVYSKLFPVKISSPQFKEQILTVIPVMPATAPTINEELTSKGLAPIKGSTSPFSKTNYEAFRSGTRSAIVPTKEIKEPDSLSLTNNKELNYTPTSIDDSEATLIRLKGCGMWLQDSQIPFPCFTLRETKTEHYQGEEKVYEVRGVAFLRTSYTELYSTNIFMNCMKSINFQCGNEVLGCWQYDKVEGDVAPDIPKCVVVMKTFGDKRCETHLLAGLEKVISNISDEEAQTLANNIIDVLNKNSKVKPDNDLRVYNRTKKLFGTGDVKKAINLKINEAGNFGYFKELANSDNFIDPEILRNTFKDINFTSKDKTYSFLALLNLYSQIGRDAGTALACVHRSGFLWGTYCDHSLAEMHCNSHPDNLVVLGKKYYFELSQLLAPVDFDMSFESRCAVGFWGKIKGVPDHSMGYDNIYGEIICMLDDLVGYSAMFEGVSTAIKAREQPKGEFRTIIIEVLRMVLAWEYLTAYEVPYERKSWISQNVYDLVELALEYTKNSNA